MTDQRIVRAEKAAWVGIAGNLALCLVKGGVGILSNSKALVADAAHSASEAVGSIAVLIGLRETQQTQGKIRSFAHGKAESIAAVFVAVLLLLIGFEIGMHSGKMMWYGTVQPPAWYALLAIIVSILGKEALFQYKYRVGKKLANQAMIENAWEYRSDVFSSITALAGIGASLAGVLLNQPALFYADSLSGLLIAFLILRMGYRLVLEFIHSTLNHMLHQEEADELLKTVQLVKGVISVDDLNAREHGHYVAVEMKISVNPRISVAEGHEIAKSVKQLLMKRFSHVSDVLIHVYPYEAGYPYKNNMIPEQDDFPTMLH